MARCWTAVGVVMTSKAGTLASFGCTRLVTMVSYVLTHLDGRCKCYLLTLPKHGAGAGRHGTNSSVTSATSLRAGLLPSRSLRPCFWRS